MTQPRSAMMNPKVMGTFHCMSRCVRHAFLCGQHPLTKRNYDHRKPWLEDRLAELADIFLIDVLAYAIMSNHVHVILRNRPDLVNQSSDRDIVCRWRRLFPLRRTPEGLPGLLTEQDISCMLADKKQVALWRSRLADISWFMALWKQPIARRANAEDGIRGRFWEGRFKSVALLDQAAILTCMVYVDLNPIRAGIAKTPEASQFTSVRRRIRVRRAKNRCHKPKTQKDSWLCPLQGEPGWQGFPGIGLDRYLALVDWSGRRLVCKEKGSIPSELEPILKRLGINSDHWYVGCRQFGSQFYRAAGKLSNMVKAAREIGQRWLKGKEASKIAFQRI